MVLNTTQTKVVQISVFVSPTEKNQIENEAKNEKRSVSNYCKLRLLEGLE